MPHAQIPAVLSHVDVLALPSVYEELGSVLVEAMRVGLPIVATQVGGIPDLITHGVNGLLVPSGNPRALAEAIGTLLDDPELARSLGEAGRRRPSRIPGRRWPAMSSRSIGRCKASQSYPGPTRW